MRVPIEWLKEYVDLGASAEEIAERLTMAGLEVEEIDFMPESELTHAGGAKDDRDSRIMLTKVTPNRGDWLSMIGVARELSAVTGWDFTIPEPSVDGTGPKAESLIKITIADPDLCRRYAGMVVKGITIKESPDWMKNRLIRAGMRPINNVVDITNYVMLELGQPLHAFDYDLLRGPEIIVRRAREGEKITTIDSIERALRSDMLVIADRDRAVAVAGVIGGFESEVSDKTTNILIESANFDAVSIRRTSKAFALVTESSYRFERGVDPGITDLAAKRAAELMKDLCGGEIAHGIVDIFPRPCVERTICISSESVNRLLGTNLDVNKMVSSLHSLRIAAKLNDNKICVTVPSFRPDMVREADVIEEIARIYGYENIGVTLPLAPVQGKDSESGLFVERLRSIFMACGMQEILTHSLIDPKSVRVTGMEKEAISVRTPLSEDASTLRTMLAPNLLNVISRNQAVGIKDVSIFEIGKVYRWFADGTVNEFRSAAAAMVGNQWANSWNLSKEALAADFFFAKGALESFLARLDIRDVAFVPVEHPLLHPTRAARVQAGETEIGILGEVAPELLDSLDIRGRTYIFELNVDQLMPLVLEAAPYESLPRFPALYRHLAVVVNRDVAYADIKRTILEAGGEIVAGVDLLDVYTGPHVGDDEHSLTLSIVFRSRQRTLTDEEVTGVLGSIKTTLSSAYGASFRG
jgi:phenylalanyl-tRNA synthetase beta chain